MSSDPWWETGGPGEKRKASGEHIVPSSPSHWRQSRQRLISSSPLCSTYGLLSIFTLAKEARCAPNSHLAPLAHSLLSLWPLEPGFTAYGCTQWQEGWFERTRIWRLQASYVPDVQGPPWWIATMRTKFLWKNPKSDPEAKKSLSNIQEMPSL